MGNSDRGHAQAEAQECVVCTVKWQENKTRTEAKHGRLHGCAGDARQEWCDGQNVSIFCSFFYNVEKRNKRDRSSAL